MEYKWVSGYDYEGIADEYEALLRPDGTEVTIITEPEDRVGYRDLSSIVDELNRLYEENKALKDSGT